MNNPSSDKRNNRLKRNQSESFATHITQRPWRLHEALFWWFGVLVSFSVVVWSGLDGWVLNRRIERIHDVGMVVSTQVQDHTLLVFTAVTTSRLSMTLSGKATLLAGDPVTLQERANGRYYLCDGYQRCHSVRGKDVSESLSEWITPQALGVSDQDQEGRVPADDMWNFFAWLLVFVLFLFQKSWLWPFGLGKTQRT